MTQLAKFIDSLRNAPPTDAIFNPWYEMDPTHDAGPDSPSIRLTQLKHYLTSRPNPRVLLIAEALGYQGGHFTGIAMTSERILLGHHREKGIPPEAALPNLPPRRTSNDSGGKNGYSEPTATIVWGALAKLGIPPSDVILWNAFPWHPFNPDRGRLSNRTPTNAELDHGAPYLRAFLDLYPKAAPIAVGKKSEALLQGLGITPEAAIRHPANGGATKFRTQLAAFLAT